MTVRVASAGASGALRAAREQLITELVGAERARGMWLVLAPHPDDETVGAGWLLRRGRHTAIALVTDGAPHDSSLWPGRFERRADYVERRRRELRAALARARIGVACVFGPWVADQQAARALPRLARVLAALVGRLRPALLIAPPYEGGHPDHDAAAFIARAAQRLVSDTDAPLLLEMTSYHRGVDGLRSACFLDGALPEVSHVLSAAERAHKRGMLACHASQAQVLAPFDVAEERYRLAPHYDFTRPPHAGELYYESMPFGWSSAEFCACARTALAELGLDATR